MQRAMTSVISLATVLVASVVLTAGEAQAQSASACGGKLIFNSGTVTLGKDLSTAIPLADDTKACLTAIAKHVKERSYIRSLTVVVRLPDDQRKANKGIEVGKAMSDVLAAGGVPQRRLSQVAPAIGHGQREGVQLVYSELRSGRPVAKLLTLRGSASYGRELTSLRSAAVNTLLRTHDYLQLSAQTRSTVQIADGSRLQTEPSTVLRFGKITLNSEYKRDVSIDVISGSVQAVASHKPGAPFRLSTRAAVAGVRGTKFRTHVAADGTTRIEVLEGGVQLGNDQGSTNVGAGYGTRVAVGQAPEEPRPLLVGPSGHRPLQGTFPTAPEVTWQAIEGATSYIVEFARNAEFSKDFTKMTVNGATTAKPDASVGLGAWFWRVSAVDKDGFIGMPSKIFKFTVDPNPPAEPDPAAQPEASAEQ